MGKPTTANLLQIESTSIDQFPGDVTGDSIIATASGSGEKGETAQVFGQPGLISNPSKGNIGLRISKGALDIVVGTLNYKIPLPENPGETLLYSTDADGVIQSKLFLDADGNFIFNDGSDFAVRYSKLEEAYNELNDKYNDLISRFSAWTPVPQDGGASLKALLSAPPSLTSTGDITPAKIEEIKVP